MINRVVLVGRLTKDPELRYTPAGIPVVTFRIAINRRFSKDGGSQETDFFNIIAWRQSAEFASNYLFKGSLIGVDGYLTSRSWTTSNGDKRSTVEIVAENLRALSPKRDNPTPEGSTLTNLQQPVEEYPNEEPYISEEIESESDPFESE